MTPSISYIDAVRVVSHDLCAAQCERADAAPDSREAKAIDAHIARLEKLLAVTEASLTRQ